MIIELKDVSVRYDLRRRRVGFRTKRSLRALTQINLSLEEGGTFGIVGESGSGKSTIGNVIMGMVEPFEGSVILAGQDLGSAKGSDLRQLQRTAQIVFQDPHASLDPRMTVARIISEPLRGSHGEGSERIKRRVSEVLDLVGLPASSAKKYPHQFSGGQLQRVAIARALAPKPQLIVLDEPTSALDVSVQAQILNLLRDIQAELGLSYVFISHDLQTVAYMASEVAVLYLGRIVEQGPTMTVYEDPTHPYTRLLMASIPREGLPIDPEVLGLEDEIPTPMGLTTGCPFQPRCSLSREMGNPEICLLQMPPLIRVRPDHDCACHFASELVQYREGTPQ